MTSILPNIIEIAQENGIKVIEKKEEQYIASCPFCGDKKTHLQLNSNKNIFYCYRCSTGGGVINFIENLTGQSRSQIMQDIYKSKGLSKRNKYFHPAMKIPQETLKKMGFRGNSNFYKKLKQNPERAKREMDFIWEEYKKYKKELKRIETKILLGIVNKINYDLEQEINSSILGKSKKSS